MKIVILGAGRVAESVAESLVSVATTILMPPPVDPAQVAKQPSSSISNGANAGHSA